MKNHVSWLIGSASFPKVNATRSNNYYGRGRSRNRKRGCGRRLMVIVITNLLKTRKKQEKRKNIYGGDTKKI